MSMKATALGLFGKMAGVSMAFLVSLPVAAPVFAGEVKTNLVAAATGNIVEVAVANGSFKTLAAALKAADLINVLTGEGPFTVFAPTDAAFAALPKGTVENLLKPENKAKLVQILTYHVVAGKVTSDALQSGEVKTVEGSPVKVVVEGKNIMVNNAQVTLPDVEASNGVIHVIDKVILP
ncbi:fasciclin domain-containing protein [Anthocerotibacter panamensis]|uniref:fasciclin domain-containing protein n=1 Tax=Anthocerotibacter panamensis TaxID=2857077 RepID=UPI001FD9C3D7|nr:fasciclin domain-containing protein [Anthocerotibacter panamensis]